MYIFLRYHIQWSDMTKLLAFTSLQSTTAGSTHLIVNGTLRTIAVECFSLLIGIFPFLWKHKNMNWWLHTGKYYSLGKWGGQNHSVLKAWIYGTRLLKRCLFKYLNTSAEQNRRKGLMILQLWEFIYWWFQWFRSWLSQYIILCLQTKFPLLMACDLPKIYH